VLTQSTEKEGIMAEEEAVAVKSWYARGWRTFKSDPKPLIIGSVIVTCFSLVVSLVNTLTGGYWVVILSQLFFIPVLSVGWFFFCLKRIRGEAGDPRIVFSAFARYGKVWGTYILFLLIVVAGIFLAVVPGILWALKYGMSLFAVMDESIAGRDALRFSKSITRGHRGKIFVAGLLAALMGGLSVPFSMGLERIGMGTATVLLAAGLVPMLAAMLIVTPWIGVAFASAYESIRLATVESAEKGDTSGDGSAEKKM
jgi:hypothetical protein